MLGLWIAAGCGTRLSHEELLNAAQSGTSGSEQNSFVAGQTNGSASEGEVATPIGVSPEIGETTARASAVGSEPALNRGSGLVARPAGGVCSAASNPIVIGSVGQQSGIVGQVISRGTKAVQAWAAAMNERGGIRCHPVKYIVVDDGGDPSRHQALVQQLVEHDHVVAFVFMDAPLTGKASQSYLTQKRIPVIGNEGASQWFYESPMYFPQTPTGRLIVRGAFGAAGFISHQIGQTKLGIVACVEADGCAQVYNLAGKYSTEFGMTLVYRGQASLAQPDFTSNCQAAQSAGVQVLLLSVDTNSVRRLARSCATVNYHPQYVVFGQEATPDLSSDEFLRGTVVGLPNMPWHIVANPEVAEFQRVLRQFAPTIEPDGAGMVGWIAAKLFETAIANVDDPTNSQAILDGLWSIRGNDLRGATVPLTFTKGQLAPPTFCFWITQIKGSQFVSPNNGQRTCG